ncbi:aryl-sulfate sulfotransferase [Clostridium paraputrificum]|uniref:aryl-sulfate sulfotransferase n=1 Tax=Clostridium paraputrificum TaxID=29363 RepID=UPI003D3598AF
MGHPTIYPTGVTFYNPKKSWSGYTIFQVNGLGALLINMNGKEVKLWKGLQGFPNKIFPGGYVLGSTGERNPKYGIQDMVDLVQVDWNGNIVWKFEEKEYIQDDGEESRWMARQHHDFQREGNSVGYYAPGSEPLVDRGNTLILCHENIKNNNISEKLLLDDKIIEVTWEGEIIWEWNINEHFEELGFNETAKNVICRDPNIRPVGGGMGDWMHINSISLLGPNKWYDDGDERFNPNNIIWSSRESNIFAIIDKSSGKIVWKVGPYYDENETLKKLGWIIGQHHVHMIPKGLPGEGNILIFDNGGWAGYGSTNPVSLTGRQNAHRDYSRVLEINPVTLEIVWQYTPKEAGLVEPLDSSRFYSPFVSSAQRLANGNTLITEGSDGRVFEITSDHEIVWEYINPYKEVENNVPSMNMIYRAYRVPYEWVPQLEKQIEVEIKKVDLKNYRIEGAEPIGAKEITEVIGVKGYNNSSAFCVISNTEGK